MNSFQAREHHGLCEPASRTATGLFGRSRLVIERSGTYHGVVIRIAVVVLTTLLVGAVPG